MTDNANHILETIAQAVARIERVLGAVEDRLRGIEARLSYVQARLARVESRLDDLVEKLEAEQKFTSDLRDDHEARITALEKK